MGLRIPADVEARCPATVGEAIPYLRAAGLSKIESIAVLTRRLGMSLGDAKATVHESETWADRRESDDAFHDQLEQALTELDRRGRLSRT